MPGRAWTRLSTCARRCPEDARVARGADEADSGFRARPAVVRLAVGALACGLRAVAGREARARPREAPGVRERVDKEVAAGAASALTPRRSLTRSSWWYSSTSG